MTLLLQQRPRPARARGAGAAAGCRHLPTADERPIRDHFFSGTIPPLTGRLTALARRIVDDEELARDAVQEACLSLWLEADLPPDPHAWLVRAVRNRCLHLARGRSRRLKHEANARRLRAEADDRDDPALRMEREDLGRIFSRSLERLPDDQRTILVLSLIDELDYQTIALVLDIPIGTVRSRLSRAKQAIRSILLRLLPDEELSWRMNGPAPRRSMKMPTPEIRADHASHLECPIGASDPSDSTSFDPFS